MRKIGLLLVVSFWVCSQAVFGQSSFSDDFSDGNFTNNPVWSGQTSVFQISATNQLQLNNTAAVSSNNSYLTTTSTAINSSSWEFYVKLDFSPSTSNFAKVYLVSDNQDLTQNLNGYFVRIGGQSGSVDDVSLYRQDGAAEVKLIDGVDGTVASSPEVKIRVTKSAANQWELFLDQSASGTSFVSEGTAIDNTYGNSSFFGVFCRYTSTRSDKFFFDDFIVSGTSFQDTTTPVLNSVAVISNTLLNLSFNEKLDNATSLNASNYSVNKGIGNPSTVQHLGTDSSMVQLQFSTPFSNGDTYELISQNIEDRSGNAMITDTSSFTYFVPVASVYRDIVINELYPDFTPSNGLPDAEFIELFNASNKVFDLAGWMVSDGTSSSTLSTQLLRPGDYIIICASADAQDFASFGLTQGQSSFPSLNNTGDNIKLFNNSGNLVDFVNYTDDWYKSDTKDDGGYSLEQIKPFTSCVGINNFTASTANFGGTPGVVNSVFDTIPDTLSPEFVSAKILSSTSVLLEFNEFLDSNSVASASYIFSPSVSIDTAIAVGPEFQSILLNLTLPIDSGVIYTISIDNILDCAGNNIKSGNQQQVVLPEEAASYRDIVINELYPDFTPSNGLPSSEFIELFNASDKVFDLAGWVIGDGSGGSTITTQLLLPGELLILCSSTNEQDFSTYGLVKGLDNFPSLNNSGDDIRLFDNSGNLIDFVNYTDNWYKDDSKDDGGYSLEQINPFTPCIGINNFTASTASLGGTPGTVNAVFDTIPDTLSPNFISATILSSTSILLEFNEFLDSNSIASASYNFNPSALVNTAVGVSPEYQSVLLSLTAPIDSGVIYTVSIDNLLDCAGNNIKSGNQKQIVLPEEAASYRDIVINEIYPDQTPSNGLPDSEFIELFNASNKVFDLSGWVIRDGSNASTLTTQLLLPGEFLILCSSNFEQDFSAYGLVKGLNDFPTLTNSGESIRLFDNSGSLIDFVFFTDDWYKNDNKDDGGYSLEQINPFTNCIGINNFTASNATLGGTPGSLNSVFDTTPDTQEPLFTNATILSSDTILLEFNEYLDSTSVADANYMFNLSISVDTAIAISPAYQSVLLILVDAPLDSGIIYALSVDGIKDCAGNDVADHDSKFIALPDEASANDIVINEILFNPRSGGVDFVEFFNRSNKVISLQNWVVANEQDDTIANKKIITEEIVVILPKSYLVITENKQNIIDEYPNSVANNIYEIKDLPSYNDDEGTVYIFNKTQLLIDAVSYKDDFQFDLLQDDDGVSLERISPDRLSSDETNFHSAAENVGFATPGYKNSQAFDGIKFDGKITVEPKIVSPDNDGFQDNLNINYQFSAPGFVANVSIYDRNGRLIKQLIKNELLGSSGTFSWDGTTDDNTKARIGVYIILIEGFNASGNKEVFKEVVTVAGFLD